MYFFLSVYISNHIYNCRIFKNDNNSDDNLIKALIEFLSISGNQCGNERVKQNNRLDQVSRRQLEGVVSRNANSKV